MSTKRRIRTLDLSPSSEPQPKRRQPNEHHQQASCPEFRLAIDFGTKFTSIACSKRNAEPFTIQGFPDDPQPDMINMQVPTEIAYLSSHTGGGRKQGPRSRIIYGYEIREWRNKPDSIQNDYVEVGCVTNAKMLLDKSGHIQSLKKQAKKQLEDLEIQKVISKPADVIRDLLVCYLQHTKKFLSQQHGLKSSSTVEVTFCVPVCWSPSANATMSACLQGALKKVNLGSSLQTVFMVNEAEAAAMYTLTSNFHRYKSTDVFMLLDCGGGTTDAGIYAIGHNSPFRLGKQITPTSGAICGSGDLNRAFYEFAMKHLRNAEVLSAGQASIADIIDVDLMPLFEARYKRSFSFNHRQDRDRLYTFHLRGLKAIKGDARIRENTFLMNYDDMEALFMPSLRTIANLMRKQIVGAIQLKAKVNKVVLAGGYSDSPALKEYLLSKIEEINRNYQTDIALITAPQNTGAACVALGALKRAKNKDHGPAKIPCQSIGIFHHVRNDPGFYTKEVLNQHEDDWEVYEGDGEYYIKNTIQWIIKKGKGDSQSVHDAEWESLHIFTPGHTLSWPYQFKLFASDECTEDFFKRSHPKNWGKTDEIGKVVFDLIPMKPHVQLHTAVDEDDGVDRYEVVIRIKMRVIDKYLEFTAYYPSTGQPLVTIQGVHEPINVISAFEPGTA